MFSFETAKREARTFGHDRRGNFGLAFAGVSAVLLIAMGYGVNVSQVYSTKSALLASLDTAVTSTARDITTGKISKEEAPDLIRAFLQTNAQNSMLRGRDVQLSDLVINDNDKTISAKASVDVAMFLPVFATGDTRRVEANSASIYSDKKIEVVMMLDVTGSMAGSKLAALKVAAKNAVDSFFNMDATGKRVRMAVVPYSTSVNAGSLAPSSVFVETKSTKTEERFNPPKNTDPILASNKAGANSCATERKGPYAISDVGPDVAMVNRDYLTKDRAGADCPGTAVIPLTNDAASLKTKITNFAANGSTAGHIGIQWSWYMLSPSWNSVLPTASRPAAYNDKKSVKVAILMTDGLFNIEYTKATVNKNGGDDVFVDNPTSRPARDSRKTAEELCAAMKQEGIEIFTIGFQLNASQAVDTMRNCASTDTGSSRHFYQAASAKELDDAFQAIAENLENLALTK